MGALRSAIEAATATDPSDLSDFELDEEAPELSRAIDMLTQRLTEVTNQVRVRGSFHSRGYVSATRWLSAATDWDDSTARRIVTLGKTLSAHPRTARQARDGELSSSRVRSLARAAAQHPSQYRDHEDMLLEFAHSMRLRDFRRAVSHWSNCADATRAEESAQQKRDRAYLHASRTYGGMVRVDGLLDPESGEELLTALDAAMTPGARRDGTNSDPAPRRRAGALAHICRQFLNNHPGVIGGQRPHVNVLIDLETLHGNPGRVAEMSRTGPITPETARRILCDAEITWALAARGQPVAVGRSQRKPTQAQLKALAIRDRGCVEPGCDRPPEWCDAHHIVHWANGGPTDLDNLELRCRRHHTRVHRNDPQLE